MDLNERFAQIPEIEAGSNVQTSQAGADTSDVTGSTVKVPNKPPAGLTYRLKLAGTKTGANAAHVVHLKLGATQVMSLTADAAGAVDWVAEFIIRFTDSKAQKVMGIMSGQALDAIADYAAGTVDCSAGAELKLQIESGHASDTVTCEMFTIEKWVK